MTDISSSNKQLEAFEKSADSSSLPLFLPDFASPFFKSLCRTLAQWPEVEAIALGGSRSRGMADPASDYDLYVYVTQLPEEKCRQKVLNDLCERTELSNAFWELEDDCTFKDHVDIDILYRNLDDFGRSVRRTVLEAQPSNSYTTCLWSNLLQSLIVFDRTGRLSALQSEMQIPFPDKLAEAIIERSSRLLQGSLASYDRQIRKAVKRQDILSMAHRTSAFLESVFDLLFALNRIPHPGEKRMMEQLLSSGSLIPDHFEQNVQALLQIQSVPEEAVKSMDSLLASISALLEAQGYAPLARTV